VVDALSFRCTACGNCCRALRVALTALDLRRLTEATGQSHEELVEWLAPDAVDMAGEPQSFVELSSGRRLMVLAQRGGACALLAADERCSAYAARPRDCQAYPFDFERAPGVSGKRRLALLPLHDCAYADDGAQDPSTLERIDDARQRELERYQELVAHWNRQAFHRRRLGKPVGAASAFLAFALAADADAS
jgi:Fe-S-cluster containining protein